MTLPVHPLEEQPLEYPLQEQLAPDQQTNSMTCSNTETPSNNNNNRTHYQQRAYSVTAMPSELQKSVMRHQEKEHQEKLKHNQPWWQYYYQLYHYQLPPGRKPTVFGPYLLLQTMGEGEFGKVKFGIEIKTGQEVAIKLIRKDSIDSASRMTKVEREISVLRILRHPNIVELFHVIETEKYIGIILQCATGGELFDYILAHRYLKERDASRLFAQLISGVHYMHQKHIVHRDLKLENLLLDRHRNVLITDFGFANQFSSPQDDLMSTSCGSPCYAAPELVMNQGVYVGPAVDIWSCGVILFAMLCGYLPYDDDPANPESYNINLLYKYILNTPLIFPDYISEEACDLLSLMLVPDPEKRCTMETIMSHPWLSAHRHLFVNIEQPVVAVEQEKDQQVPIEPIRRNTIGPSYHHQEQQQQTISNNVIMEETTTNNQDETVKEEPEPEQEPTEPAKEEPEAVVPDQDMEEVKDDTPMQDISAIELPPIIQQENDETEVGPQATTSMIKVESLAPDTTTSTAATTTTVTTATSPITIDTSTTAITSTNNDRPKSTSTEKVLHFLSGQNNTPKPCNTNEKRTRHMSLAVEESSSSTSILQAKFLSSIHQRKNHSQQQQLTPESSPSPNSSASTPYPTANKNNKRNIRLSTITPPTSTTTTITTTTVTNERGTRRKTLSLLVNSMTDNNKMPFAHRRQSNVRPTHTDDHHARAQMMPSVSEHTMNTLTDKEKHRSAGKKLMDWFKKKPLSTMHRSTNHPGSDTTMLHNNDRLSVIPSSTAVAYGHHSELENSITTTTATATSDPKLRTHHGAVDQEALTSRPPAQVFSEVKQTLKALGLEFKRDGGEYKLKCVRPKRAVIDKRKLSHSSNNMHRPPFRNLLRRASGQHGVTTAEHQHEKSISATAPSSAKPATIYGDPNVDPGEEVRFSVELCKIKNLPGLYIVDMRRMRGNVWAYKFIYRTLLDTLKLGGKKGYLNTTNNKKKEGSQAVEQEPRPADTAAIAIEDHSTTEDTHSHHRMSTASSSGGNSSSVLLDDVHTTPSTPTPTANAREIAV